MPPSHSTIIAVTITLLIAGCATPRAASKPAPTTAPPSTGPSPSAATATPAPAGTSAFCLDLTTFQIGILVWRNDVLEEVRKGSPDLKGLQQRAVMIEYIGEKMQESAPADIAKQLRAVRKAIAASAMALKPGRNVRDVIEPLYNKRITPAFDAVDAYQGCPGDF
ncbi:hypothetical protein [Nonomuraea rubra]|uniref:hypothetical protein n=1 Tax=Nonomuraea rubra TaxID=46180 RepID=UPI0033F8E7C5